MATNATRTTDAPNQNNADDVETVDGIGPTFAERLREGGIETRQDVADADKETLMDVSEAAEHRVDGWIDAVNTPSPRTVADDLTPAITAADDNEDDVTPPREITDEAEMVVLPADTPAVTPVENDKETPPETDNGPREMADSTESVVSETEEPAVTPVDTDDTDEETEDTPDYDYRKFSLSNIKNYAAAAVASAHHGDTDTLLENYVTSMASEARNGAEEIGLLDGDHDPTQAGWFLAGAYADKFGGLGGALDHFKEMKGTRGRYVEAEPWALDVLRPVMMEHEQIQILADVLEAVDEPLTLRELTERMYEQKPEFVKQAILRDGEREQERVFGAEGDELNDLESAHVYRSTTAHKLKSVGYHAGVFTTTGDVPSRLEPTEQMWAIETADPSDLRDDEDDEDDEDIMPAPRMIDTGLTSVVKRVPREMADDTESVVSETEEPTVTPVETRDTDDTDDYPTPAEVAAEITEGYDG
jgi:hypothetical protein